MGTSDKMDFWDKVWAFFEKSERYGNYGGGNWTNGRYDPDAVPILWEEADIDPTGKSRKPIDKLDFAYMHHDYEYWKAQEEEALAGRATTEAAKAAHLAKAEKLRYEADKILLRDIARIRKGVADGTIKLGINGEGKDTRTDLLEKHEDTPPTAHEMMGKANAYFGLQIREYEKKHGIIPDDHNDPRRPETEELGFNESDTRLEEASPYFVASERSESVGGTGQTGDPGAEIQPTRPNTATPDAGAAAVIAAKRRGSDAARAAVLKAEEIRHKQFAAMPPRRTRLAANVSRPTLLGG